MRRIAGLTLAGALGVAAVAPADPVQPFQAPPPGRGQAAQPPAGAVGAAGGAGGAQVPGGAGGVAFAPLDQGKIQEAIKRGAEYLRKFRGGGNDGHSAGHPAGLASLVGLALLEAGAKADDPALASIVQFVRTAAYQQGQTYCLSLMVIFLDRLNDPSDVPLIQLLGCRLLSGQSPDGGWGYVTWMAGADEAKIRAAVGVKDPAVIRPQPQPDPGATPPPPPKLHSEAAKIYNAVRSGARSGNAQYGRTDDNSNTQFAIVAMWVSQRRGVPCNAAFRALESRFLRSQSPTDHGWGYTSGFSGAGSSSPSMTCAGLIGLAVAAARDDKADKLLVGDPAEKKKLKEDDPFFNPPSGKGGGDPDAPPPEEEEEKKEKSKSPMRDAAIERGLRAIGGLLKGNLRGGAGIGDGQSWGGVSDLYFYWSLERVAVAFGLNTIGDVDWYGWGSERILKMQTQDGSWGGNYGNEVGTSFAILFLARSNFVSDLSAKIKGKVKDPGAAELKGTRGGPLGLSGTGSVEAVRAPGEGGAKTGGPQGPGDLAKIQAQTAAEKVAEGLVKATDAAWKRLLQEARIGNGGHYTAGLVRAIGQLDGKRQYDAREVLADRLAGLTADTLRRYLTDRDPELRRAAALACGMKDDKMHVRDLIDRVTDLDESVIRAAKASLKSMTTQDFGPATGANDEQKENAQRQWLVWFAAEGRGR